MPDDNQATETPAVRCDDLLAGDKVTWTHASRRGKSTINFTTRKGVVEHILPDDLVQVNYRGQSEVVPRSEIRKAGERTALTDMVLGQPANAPDDLRPPR